jgi:tRNA(Arg) A34 adenosine deaminase TadA
VENKKKLMRQAVSLSAKGLKKGGGPFGAIVVKDGKIIASGYNEVTIQNDPTAHAEVVAIRKACKKLGTFDLSDCEIYTSCEPCPMCLSAMYWAKVKNFYFANTKEDAANIGFDDAFIYTEIKKTTSLRSIHSQQLLQDEAIKIFKEWEEKEDKKIY